MGRLKEDFDKSKKKLVIQKVFTSIIDKTPCKVVDVILNPKVVTTIKKDNNALLFFYQLVNNYLQQKYQIELEESRKHSQINVNL